MIGKEYVKLKLMLSVDDTNKAAEKADNAQNYIDYGAVTAYGDILRSIGVRIFIPAYRDNNDCIQIPFIEIDGQKHLEKVKEAAS